MSTDRNKSAAYYSDISITVYDQVNQQANSYTANRPSDVIVKVTHQPASQLLHPQIKNMTYRNHSQSSLSNLPIGLSTFKSVSVNDFTGSILGADRTNYYNRQNAAAAAAASAKMNQTVIDPSEPLYSNVVRKENSSNVCLNRYVRSDSSNPTDGYTYHQAARNHQRVLNSFINKVDQTINIELDATGSLRPSNSDIHRTTPPAASTRIQTQIPVPRKSLSKSDLVSTAVSEKKVEHLSKKSNSPKGQKKKNNNDGSGLSDSTESMSSLSSGSPKLDVINPVEIEETGNEIVKKLAELESINQRNIEQLKRLEQDYSVSSLHQEIPISIRLADDGNKEKCETVSKYIRKRSKTPELFMIVYDKNADSTVKSITKTRYDGSDLTPVLSSSSIQSPQLSPNSHNSAQETSFNLTQSSSSSALSSKSQTKQTPEDVSSEKSCNIQSSIDIEIYNINNQIDDYNDYPLKGSTQLRPKINQRKKKPFRINCSDNEVESDSKNRFVKQKISSFLTEIQSDKPEQQLLPSEGDIKSNVDSINNTNASELSAKTENLAFNETSTPSCISPMAMDEDLPKNCDHLADSDDGPVDKIGCNNGSHNGSFSSLNGSLNHESAKGREKSFKRRKNSQRQIKRSQTIEKIETVLISSITNQLVAGLGVENIERQDLKEFRKPKDTRRDRRQRHTMPITDIKSYNQEPVSKKDTEMALVHMPITKNSAFSSDDEKNKVSYLKPKPPSFQRRERIRLSAERIDTKVIEWQTSSTVLEPLNISSQIEINQEKEEILSLEEPTLSDLEIVKNDLIKESLEATETTQAVILDVQKSSSKSDSESMTVDKARSVIGKSIRKKHDSTDTIDSTSSYECRFERISLSEKQQSLKDKLEEKNRMWNLMHKAKEDLNTSLESEPSAQQVEKTELVSGDESEREASENNGKSVEVVAKNELDELKVRTETSETESSSVYLVSNNPQTGSLSSPGQKKVSKAMTDDGYSSTVSFKNTNVSNESYSSIDDAGSEISSSQSSTSKIREIAVEEETKNVMEQINTVLSESALDLVPKSNTEFGNVCEEVKAELSEKLSDSEIELSKDKDEIGNFKERIEKDTEVTDITNKAELMSEAMVEVVELCEDSDVDGLNAEIDHSRSVDEKIKDDELELKFVENVEIKEDVSFEYANSSSDASVEQVETENLLAEEDITITSDEEMTTEKNFTETVEEPVAIEVSGETVAEPVAIDVSGETVAEPGAIGVFEKTVAEPVAIEVCGETVAEPVAIEVSGETVAEPVAIEVSGETVAEPVAIGVSGERVAEPVAIEVSGERVAEPGAIGVFEETVAEPGAIGVFEKTVAEPVAIEVSGETVAEPVAIEVSGETVGSIIDSLTSFEPDLSVQLEIEDVTESAETVIVETASHPVEIEAADETVDSIVQISNVLNHSLCLVSDLSDLAESAHKQLIECLVQPIDIDSGVVNVEEIVVPMTDVDLIPMEIVNASIVDNLKVLKPELSLKEQIEVFDKIGNNLETASIEAPLSEKTTVSLIESIETEVPNTSVDLAEFKTQAVSSQFIDDVVGLIAKDINEASSNNVNKVEKLVIVGLKPDTAMIVDELKNPEPVKRISISNSEHKESWELNKSTKSVVDELINMIQPEKESKFEARISSILDDLMVQIEPESRKKLAIETNSIVDDLIKQIQPENSEMNQNYQEINMKGILVNFVLF